MPKHFILAPQICLGIAIAAILSFPLSQNQQSDPTLRLAVADVLLLGLAIYIVAIALSRTLMIHNYFGVIVGSTLLIGSSGFRFLLSIKKAE
jgi:hypothetical protein